MTDKTEFIEAARGRYDSYDADVWIRAYFDEKSGGYNVYHKAHYFSKTGGGGYAEKKVGEMLAKYNGKQVEFLPEGRIPVPDIKFDNMTWDIKYIDHANEETIRTTIRDARKADNAIFYFTDKNKYVLLNNAIKREAGRLSKGQTKIIPDVYCIDKHGILKLIWKKQKGAM